MTSLDNGAIERIASPDLTDDALALLKNYANNDDVVFLLGRLVWQGKMVGCVPTLLDIACDANYGRYARIAAIRAVMTVGDENQILRLWTSIADEPGPLDLRLLAELMPWSAPTVASVNFLLRSLEHSTPNERFDSSGLQYTLHAFVDALPVMADDAADRPLGVLVTGLNALLSREPLMERGECRISKEWSWLMPAALHTVDRLVAARSKDALLPAAISVLRNMPRLRFWRLDHHDDYESSLDANVPRWRELNDLLYWSSVEDHRAHPVLREQLLLDDVQVDYLGHYWQFSSADFERCIEWVRTREGDDRFVALGRSVQLYVKADRPAAWLDTLLSAASDDEGLRQYLDARLNPPPLMRPETNAEHLRWMCESEDRRREEKQNREDWVRTLKADPDRVVHPTGLKPGEFSMDQYHLLISAMGGGLSATRDAGANWRSLIPEFGDQVARAYRDAAVAHWRVYRPALRSDGADATTTPASLVFAMTGLAIESSEDSAFADRLSESEARLAFRYVTWELNGFPTWFESLYRRFPAVGSEAVNKELLWEMEQHDSAQPLHYILSDILYHAPWLHSDISPTILEWLNSHTVFNAEAVRQCIGILRAGGIDRMELAACAKRKVQKTRPVWQWPQWFALWVDTDPEIAIPALDTTLKELPADSASEFAQQFCVELLGERHGAGARIGAYRSAKHLKALYLMMHRYVPISDDIDRANGVVYSPTLRDNAQEARNTLFNMLVQVPGPDAYAAMKELELEHPEPAYRRVMAARARERATIDADEPLWTVAAVRDFNGG